MIPAFNEAERIGPTLERLIHYFSERGDAFEILVVDDGSEDATGRLVRERQDPTVRLVSLAQNSGKGAAIGRGVAEAAGTFVLLTDADLSAPIEEIVALESKVEQGYALVCGSRGLPQSDIGIRQPFYREWMGKSFNHIIRALGLTRFRDTQCGFKLVRTDVARSALSRCIIRGFAYDVELLYETERAGHRTAEVPIRWRHVPESRVRPVRDSARMFIDVLRLRLRSLVRRAP